MRISFPGVFAVALLLMLSADASAGDISGVLLDTTGDPAKQIEMCLLLRRWDMAVSGGDLPTESYTQEMQKNWPPGQGKLWFTATDNTGQFSFPRPSADFVLTAATDGGYLIAKFDKDSTDPLKLRLTAWARVSGTVTLGENPAPAGMKIEASDESDEGNFDPLLPLIRVRPASTDERGQFHFDRLFSHPYEFTRGGRHIRVKLAAGKTTEVTLSLSGRPVTGQIELPESLKGREDLYVEGGEVRADLHMPDLSLPADFLTRSPADQLAWAKEWQKSPQGLRTIQEWNQQRDRRGCHMDPGNRFKLQEIDPGPHTITVQFLRHPKDGPLDYEHWLGAACYRFTMPAIPRGASEEPLDVGTLQPLPEGTANIGQLAPDIAFQTLDGKPARLSQFKGKVILLDFWGTWCGVCVADLPHIQQIHQQFKDNPDFVQISLSVDDTPEKLRRFVDEHQMTWTQAILGDRKSAWQTTVYEVPGYPTYWLIGRDGRTLYNDWRSHDLPAAVAKALESPQG